jgi:hypothetical protein
MLGGLLAQVLQEPFDSLFRPTMIILRGDLKSSTLNRHGIVG